MRRLKSSSQCLNNAEIGIAKESNFLCAPLTLGTGPFYVVIDVFLFLRIVNAKVFAFAAPDSTSVGNDEGVTSLYEEINVTGFQTMVEIVGRPRQRSVAHTLHFLSVCRVGDQRGGSVQLCRVIYIHISFGSVS